MKKSSVFLLFCFFFSLFCFSQEQSFTGKWKTVDDEDGKTKSIISIFKSADGKYYGKIEKLLLNPGAVCDACEGDKKGKAIEGMVIIEAMELLKEELVKGTILDPATGKIYYCKISYDKKKEKLKVKGSLDKTGFLGKTQYWLKHEE